METNKKKRNSILRNAHEDEVRASCTKRKISFSRRKSVREFTASEETKAWNHSYEVSDPKNNSDNTTAEKSVQNNNSTKISQHGLEDKENICTAEKSFKMSVKSQPIIELQLGSYIEKNLSLEVPVTEKNHLIRPDTRPGNFSFPVADYEAENLRRSASLCMEAEQTACFRKELESPTGAIKKLNATNFASKSKLSLPNIECDMDISQEESDSARRKTNVIPSAMDVVAKSNQDSFNVALVSTNLKAETPHVENEIVPNTCKTIHFSNDQQDAMDITMSLEDFVLDVSMQEAFSSPKKRETSLELTKHIALDMNVESKVPNENVKEKIKPVVEHKSSKAIEIKKFEIATENNDMDCFSQQSHINAHCQEKTQLFDGSLGNWNLEVCDMNKSANATTDSDSTLSELRTNSDGAKLNYRQLNEEFEKGRINLFYNTPSKTPINLLKKRADFQRSKLDNDSVMELSFHKDQPNELLMSDSVVKIQQQMTNTIWLTPRAINPQKLTSLDRSIMEFEGFELETRNEIFQTPLNDRVSALRAPRPRRTQLFNDCSSEMLESDKEQHFEVEAVGSKKRYTVHNYEDIEIDVQENCNESKCKNSQAAENLKGNKRFTLLDNQDIDIDKDVNKNNFTSKTVKSNKRHTLIEPQDMDAEEDCSKNVNKIYQKTESVKTNKRHTIVSPQDIDCAKDSSKTDGESQQTSEEKKQHSMYFGRIEECIKNVNCVSNKRRTIIETQPIDIEQDSSKNLSNTNQETVSINTNRRRTILEQDDIDVEDDSLNNVIKSNEIRESCKRKNRHTISEPLNIDAEEELKPNQLQRKVGYDNLDADDSSNNVIKNNQLAESCKRKNRHTILKPVDVDAEEDSKNIICKINQNAESINPNLQHRTIEADYINVEDDSSKNVIYKNNQAESKKKSRRTILESLDIDVEEDSMKIFIKNNQSAVTIKHHLPHPIVEADKYNASVESKKQSRRTILETLDIDVETDSTKNLSKSKKATEVNKTNRRNTLLEPECIDITEDSLENLSKNTKNLAKVETSKRRQTIMESQDIDMEEDCTKNTPNTKIELENIEVQQDVAEIGLKNKRSSKRRTIMDRKDISIDEKKDPASETDSPLCKFRGIEREKKITPIGLGKSLIPVRISSAKKNNSTLSDSQQQSETFDFSVCTLPVPRRLLQAAEKSVIEVFPQNEQLSETKKACEMFEDHPITISDVSDYFQVQRNKSQFAKQDEDVLSSVPVMPNISANYSEMQPDNLTMLTSNKQRYSVANTTICKMEQFNDYYMNLSCDSISQIENISPVHSMNILSVDEKCEDADNDVIIVELEEPPRKLENIVVNDTQINATSDTLVLPFQPAPEPDIGMADLLRWRKKNKLSDLIAQYRRVSLDMPLNLPDRTTPSTNITLAEDVVNDDWFSQIKFKYFELIKTIENSLKETDVQKTNTTKVESSINRLCRLLKEQCANWLVNSKMQYRRKLCFYHRRLPKECFEVVYAEKNGPCGEIEILQLKRLSKNSTKNWRPLDFIIDFQLKLELPHNLKQYYNCHDIRSLCETMCTIDQICTDVKQLCISLYRIVIKQDAQLIRCGIDTYVQKFVRRLILNDGDDYAEVQKVEYRIEVRHLRQLSFRNIVLPRLYEFREDIQFLPSGLDFLQEFLFDPEKYLKQ